ncbi:DUF4961 domain-containing protein [Winogradskyella bathintestinalis]|uniref:DUF4961 domain-containing protein n=1 Tax=Winogradskyella bathintestinalis TaxID=3035208 RepID=A0ABT7ZXS9_9FLAO|nr:DUF4961 domain-containing protein [Winogradskyella bathintestinalis]MDN3493538.1 DUF4961 domain-containing protein [Winogradskyella bathintestinalis]
MKKVFIIFKRRRVLRVLLLFAFLIFTMCMTITGVIQPHSATVGEEISVTVNVRIQPQESTGYNFIFGVLAPVSWNVEENATVTYSSPVGNGTLRLATDADIATNSMLTWSEEIESVVGIGENYGLVKWTVFISESPVNVEDGVTVDGQVSLALTVGQENINTQMGYLVANSGYGIGLDFGDAPAYNVNFTPCIEISGADNNLINLCGPAPYPVVVKPNVRTLKDIIKINFDAAKGDTSLFDVEQVYFCGTALVDGVEVSNCGVNNANIMDNIGGNLWEITFWPNSFFGADPNSVISDMTYTFQNEVGDIIIQDPDTLEDFILIENCD